MNCQNCGAPKKIVSGRDYFSCEYCDSVHLPDASRDGVKIMGEPSQLECPICEIPLVSASIAGAPGLSCSRCRGVLCRAGDFSFVVRFLRSQLDDEEEYEPRPLDRTDLQREVRCPKCRQVMSTHPYYGPGNVVVDNCVNCGLIWLDYGELYKITHATGSDRRSS